MFSVRNKEQMADKQMPYIIINLKQIISALIGHILEKYTCATAESDVHQ